MFFQYVRILLLVYLLKAGLTSFGQVVNDKLLQAATSQSIGVQVTTIGPGIVYAREVSQANRLAVVARGHYLAYKKPILLETAPGSFLQMRPDALIGFVQAGLHWHPFRRGSFFLATGLAYTWHPYVGVVATAEGNLNLGGLELTSEDVGSIDLQVRWRPILGYLGWGFGRVIPRRRVGLGFEMGVFYLGRPRIDLHYEGFLETTNLSEQVPVLEHNLRHYRYLPTLNLQLSYRVSR